MNSVRKEIYSFIVSEITNESLKPGDRLPTENELAKDFSTNRSAVHRAIKRLENEGIVTRNKSQGTFVSLNLTKADGYQLKCEMSPQIYIVADVNKSRSIHWDSSTLDDLERRLIQGNRKVIYKKLPETRNAFQEIMAEICESGAKAIVFLPDQLDTDFLLKNKDIFSNYDGDIYMLSRGGRSTEDYPCHVLSVNPEEEGFMAGTYLVNKGFENIYFLQAKRHPHNKYWVKSRREGAKNGVLSASDGKIEMMELWSEKSDDEIFTIACDAIRNSQSKCAFIALNDEAAVKFIEYAKNDNLKPGKDYAVISFNNDPIWRNYNLTTVAPPIERVGETLAKMILENEWSKAKGVQLIIKLKSSIIERTTC